MSNNKQSSIEWLFEQYKLVGMLTTAQVDKAKAMHKEEIIEAREDGHTSTYTEYDSHTKFYLEGVHEQYYNKTFGGNNENNL